MTTRKIMACTPRRLTWAFPWLFATGYAAALVLGLF
jgi:hypothetical protein